MALPYGTNRSAGKGIWAQWAVRSKAQRWKQTSKQKNQHWVFEEPIGSSCCCSVKCAYASGKWLSWRGRWEPHEKGC